MDDCTNQEPRGGQRIKNKDEFKRKVGRGSHVAKKTCRLGTVGYYHHFLVTQVVGETVHIIEYGKSQLPMYFVIQKQILGFDQDLTEESFEQGVFLIWSDAYPTSDQDKEAAVDRALSRLGESIYMMAINNCEHFVTWALTGKPLSHQILDANPLRKSGTDIIDACINKTTVISESGKILTRTLALQQTGNQTVNPAGKTAGNKMAANAGTKAIAETTDTIAVEKEGKMITSGTGNKAAETVHKEVPNNTLGKGDGIDLKAAANSAVGNNGTTYAEIASAISSPTAGNAVVTVVAAATTLSVAKEIGELVVKTADKELVNSAAKTATMYTEKAATETAGKALADKAGTVATEKAGKAIGVVAKKTAQKEIIFKRAGTLVVKKAERGAEAAGKAVESVSNSKSLLKSAAKAAAIAAVIEGTLLAKDLYDLKQAHNTGKINRRDFERGAITKTSGSVGSVGGAFIGQLICPVPVVGAVVGGMVAKTVCSVVSGFLFDHA